MKYLRLACLVSLLLSGIYCYGQTDPRAGYIVLNSGDTVTGTINYREGLIAHESVVFKDQENAEYLTYLPYEILGYGYKGDRIFESKTIQLEGVFKAVFVETLVKGRVSLHRHQETFFLGKDTVWVSLAYDDTPFFVNGIGYTPSKAKQIALMNILMSDCRPDFVSDILFNERFLVKEVEKYNQCVNSDYVVYKADKKWVSLGLGVEAGMISSSFKVHTESSPIIMGPFNADRSGIMGLNLRIGFPRTSERWTFTFTTYAPTDIRYRSYVIASPTQNVFHTDIKLSQTKLLLGTGYGIPINSTLVRIEGGISRTTQQSSSAELIYESGIGTVYYSTTSTKMFDVKRRQRGVWFGTTISRPILGTSEFYVSFRYETTRSIIYDGYVIPVGKFPADKFYDSKVTNFTLTTGVLFRQPPPK